MPGGDRAAGHRRGSSAQWLEQSDPLYRIHGGATLIAGVVFVCLATALVWRAQQEMGDACARRD